MDDYARAVLLGLVQALTEFLPVSSSGHLVVAARLFGDEVNALTFDVGLHLGTTAAVLLYFRRDWALLLASVRRDLRAHGPRAARWRWRSRLALLLALATLPAAGAGAALQLTVGEGLREPRVVGVTLIAGGAAMWALDAIGGQARRLRDLGAGGAWLIGVAQACALVPGVSRSGAAIAAGRGAGLRRPDAARFAFLLSAPIVIGVSAALLGEALLGGGRVGWGPLLCGALTAALAGLAVIRGLLAFLRRRGLGLFACYRLAAGAAVLAAVRAGVL